MRILQIIIVMRAENVARNDRGVSENYDWEIVNVKNKCQLIVIMLFRALLGSKIINTIYTNLRLYSWA